MQSTFTVMNNDVLMSIPLFLFMGYMVERANILDRLFQRLQIALKDVPASLAVATLVTCALFATATGIVGAVVTLMGLLAFPQMLKAGYDVRLAAGVVCAGGCLGILIPPSIMLIVYGATAGVSVVKLYAAAFIPGFMLAGLYIVYVIVRGASSSPSVAPPLPQGGGATSASARCCDAAHLVLPAGAADPVGAGRHHVRPGDAVRGGRRSARSARMVLAGGLPRATWQKLRESVFLTARTTAMVCWLFVGSATFSSVFAYLGGNVLIKDFVLGLNLTPITFLLLTQVIIFMLGWPLEWTEIIVIFVPIFLPLLTHFGIDPMFFGMLVALNTADRVPLAAGGDGRVLPEGRRARRTCS